MMVLMGLIKRVVVLLETSQNALALLTLSRVLLRSPYELYLGLYNDLRFGTLV